MTKLQNKETGEIGSLQPYGGDGKIRVWVNNRPKYRYNSLAELCAKWEDCKEPKGYWAIDCFNPDGELVSQFGKCSERIIENRKQIGNYFETKEETEKAVEKLKAITRLSKCGFRFEGYNNRDRVNGGDIVIYAHVDTPHNSLIEDAQPAMLKALDLLFSGDEE